MIWCDIFVEERVSCGDPLPGVEDEHLLEKVKCYARLSQRDRTVQVWQSEQTWWIRVVELLAERYRLPFGERLNESESLVRVDNEQTCKQKLFASLTFSLAMVLMTSSGGVPRSSVMMEN